MKLQMAAMTIESNDISLHPNNALSARREARRRKILENADSRLKKLTGVEQKSNITIDDFRPIKYGDQDMNATQSSPLHYPHHSENSSAHLTQLLNSSSNSTSELIQSNSTEQRSVACGGYKLHILIGIAFLANLLVTLSSIISDETDLNIGCNMIFLPLLCYKLIEYCMQRSIVPENSILQLVVMANFRDHRLKKALTYFQYLTSFSQDLCAYVFVFVLMNHLFRIALVFR